MNGIVFSDDAYLANKICDVSNRTGVNCELVCNNEAQWSRIWRSREVHLVFIVMDDDANKTMTLLDRIAAVFTAKIVVVGSSANASTVVEFMRRGAFDYIDVHSDFENEIAFIVRRMSLAENEISHRLTSIAVLSTGDMSDSDLVATNFASDLASQSGQCCLLELRFWGAGLASRLQLDPHHTLDDLLAHTHIDPQMLVQSLSQHSSGIQLLSGSFNSQSASVNEDRITAPVLEYSRSQNMPTVICFDDYTGRRNIDSVSQCDFVVVCSRLDIASLWRTEKRLRHLVENGIAKELLHVIAVDFDNGFHPSINEVRNALNCTNLHMVPLNAVEQTISTNLGQPVINQYPHCRMSVALKSARRLITGDQPERLHSLGTRLLRRIGLRPVMTN